MDAGLRRVQRERDFEKARRLLKAAIVASREHFHHEEQSVFPLIESVLQPATLVQLEHARMRQRATVAS
jgi:hypothetical protein